MIFPLPAEGKNITAGPPSLGEACKPDPGSRAQGEKKFLGIYLGTNTAGRFAIPDKLLGLQFPLIC